MLWFGPSKPASDHNMYGNVSFSISMKDVVDRFGSRFYYIDQLEFKTHSATRILLSNKDHDQLEEVDFSEQGSPLKRRRWRHVAKCDSEHSSVHPHEVEIGIEVNKDDCRWLYSACSVEGSNHSCANSLAGRSKQFKNHVCHRFNTFGMKCPYSFEEDYAQTYLEERFPDLFDDESESESDQESESEGDQESEHESDQDSETESDQDYSNSYDYNY